jgi:hypothetical protein
MVRSSGSRSDPAIFTAIDFIDWFLVFIRGSVMYLSITVVEIETKDKGIAGECKISVMMFFFIIKTKAYYIRCGCDKHVEVR